jgi:GT2 family glycosyltransferase
MPGRPLLSLNTTNYNTMPHTRESLESVLGRLEGLDWELAVTDNLSTDGSYEVLQEAAAKYTALGHRVTVIRRRCSRGLGRRIAFRETTGEVTLTFDLDTVYNDHWRRLVDWYLRNRPPWALIATYAGCYPRAALEAVDGWRDFQYWEDVDLWIRLATKGLWRTYPMKCGFNYKRVPTGLRNKLPRLYAKLRDTIAVASWIPFRFYRKGYGALFPFLKGPKRALYYRGLVLAAWLPARYRRWKYCRKDFDPGAMLSSDLVLNLGLVPREELRPQVSIYDTREGVEAAFARGDYGFLPGTYD